MYTVQPLFISAYPGPLFALFYKPRKLKSDRAIIYLPPFAEEMNLSRHKITSQARSLAEEGHVVLVLDLYGTGDSAGEFGEATWDIWLENIAATITWLKKKDIQTIDLLGQRTGALLAMDFIRSTRHKIDRLIVLQPVFDGDTFATQFLRLRIYANLPDQFIPHERISHLKQQLLSGQALEVAGYNLSPELIVPIMKLKTNDIELIANNGVKIVFLEN